MPFFLGKKPARDGAITFRFARYFDRSALPTPPKIFGRYAAVHQWEVLGNDACGDCVWAGAAHEQTPESRDSRNDDCGCSSLRLPRGNH